MKDGANEIFAAERILKHRVKKGVTEYLIKWRDFTEKHNSWEPERNILDQRLIDFYKCNQKPGGTTKRGGKKKAQRGKTAQVKIIDESQNSGENIQNEGTRLQTNQSVRENTSVRNKNTRGVKTIDEGQNKRENSQDEGTMLQSTEAKHKKTTMDEKDSKGVKTMDEGQNKGKYNQDESTSGDKHEKTLIEVKDTRGKQTVLKSVDMEDPNHASNDNNIPLIPCLKIADTKRKINVLSKKSSEIGVAVKTMRENTSVRNKDTRGVKIIDEGQNKGKNSQDEGTVLRSTETKHEKSSIDDKDSRGVKTMDEGQNKRENSQDEGTMLQRTKAKYKKTTMDDKNSKEVKIMDEGKYKGKHNQDKRTMSQTSGDKHEKTLIDVKDRRGKQTVLKSVDIEDPNHSNNDDNIPLISYLKLAGTKRKFNVLSKKSSEIGVAIKTISSARSISPPAKTTKLSLEQYVPKQATALRTGTSKRSTVVNNPTLPHSYVKEPVCPKPVGSQTDGKEICKKAAVLDVNMGSAYWMAKKSIADKIVVTDVTIDFKTVTILECSTEKGFFKDPNNSVH